VKDGDDLKNAHWTDVMRVILSFPLIVWCRLWMLYGWSQFYCCYSSPAFQPPTVLKMADGVHSMPGKPDGMHTYSTRDNDIVIVVEEAPSHAKHHFVI